ncbi:hypothetical protein [Leuconostoc lactis]|uniref:hypothetical protein n=1 Tax=Leuconostoc lactis TaxID=1246 RepID=UPI0008152D23|nr:hypothetical protein [Leuconostoc lactis]ANY10953.1 hypothetical protein BCR17_00375 [Leuconostoc lactis]
MTQGQLELLDEPRMDENQHRKYVAILVKRLKNNLVEDTKKQAYVALIANDMKVKGELFNDNFGNYYVGCTVLKGIKYSEAENEILVFKLSKNIQDFLAKRLTPIVNELDKKRRGYYAK